MKRLVPMVTMVVLAMSVGCGEKGGPSKSQTSPDGQTLESSVPDASMAGIPITKQGDTPKTSLDKEAAKQALDLWKPRKLGECHYVCLISREPHNTDTVRIFFELRKVGVELCPIGINEADKLNGIQWRGIINLTAEAARHYCPQAMKDTFGGTRAADKTWSQWDAHVQFQAFWDKTNGKWSVSNLQLPGLMTSKDEIITFKQVEASEFPK